MSLEVKNWKEVVVDGDQQVFSRELGVCGLDYMSSARWGRGANPYQVMDIIASRVSFP